MVSALGGQQIQPDALDTLARSWVERCLAQRGVREPADRMAELLNGMFLGTADVRAASMPLLGAVLMASIEALGARPRKSIVECLDAVLQAVGGGQADPLHVMPILEALARVQGTRAVAHKGSPT